MQGTKAAVKELGREMPHILVVDDERSIGELLEIGRASCRERV